MSKYQLNLPASVCARYAIYLAKYRGYIVYGQDAVSSAHQC